MSASLFLHLPPGALGCDDIASLSVSWCQADGACGEGRLDELLAATPTPAPLLLILSAADVHLATVQMTRQQSRHLKKVLPFLLEESLLDSSEELLFVAATAQQAGHRVAAVRRAPLQTLALFFREQGYRLEAITVDADLLANRAPCLLPVADEWLLLDAKGQALVVDAAGLELLVAQAEIASDALTEFDRASVWPALQAALADGQPLNLLQRQWQLPLKHQPQDAGLWRNWRPSLALAVVLLLLVWVGVGVQTWRYQAAEQQWQDKANTLFVQLFPEDRATAKLRAQFKSHLARLTRAQAGGDFLGLMRAAGPVLAQQKKAGVNPTRIQYDQRNGELLLDIDAASYAALQQLRNLLQAAHLKTEISVAKTQAKGVSARLLVEQG